MHDGFGEQRRSPRERRSSALFWRRSREPQFEMAWMLEASTHGLAFAWRGQRPPAIGSVLEVKAGGQDDDRPFRLAVRRVSRAHDDLCVIAGERMDFPQVNTLTASAEELRELVRNGSWQRARPERGVAA